MDDFWTRVQFPPPPPCAPALTVKYINDIRLPAFYKYDL